MAEEDTAAFGIYRDRLSTSKAIDALRDAGFRHADIVALFPDEIGTWQFSPKKQTKFIEGALVGGVAGLGIAGALAWLFAAISLLPMSFAFTLPILAAGGAAGSFVGAIGGRRTEAHKQRYETRVRRGDIVVSVQCDDAQLAEKARDVLNRTGGEDVSSSDRVTVDFVRTNRILVRAISERTSVPPLRLVPREKARWDLRGAGGSLASNPRGNKKHWPHRFWS